MNTIIGNAMVCKTYTKRMYNTINTVYSNSLKKIYAKE